MGGASLVAAPAGEKELSSADRALDALPPKAFLDGKPGTELELDAVFEAGADDLRSFFGEAGFEETPYEFKKAFFGTLTQLFSADAPTKLPPAPKWLAPPFTPGSGDHGAKPQDLSFIRLQKEGRQGVYLWRLPFRTKKAPLWAAGHKFPGGDGSWAWLKNKMKGRALELKARPSGKTCFIFTLH